MSGWDRETSGGEQKKGEVNANVGERARHSFLTVGLSAPYHLGALFGERATGSSILRLGLEAVDVSENRKHARVTSRLRCWCEGENITVYARIGNLSEGGLFLCTSTPLSEGSRALLRFGIESQVEAPARVVWARLEGQGGPPGMGLAFEGVDESRLETIRRLIVAESKHSTKSVSGAPSSKSLLESSSLSSSLPSSSST